MRKALRLATVLVFITSIAGAQITKGKTLLGGTVVYNRATASYSDNSFYPAKQDYLTVNPAVGITIKENLIVGVEGSYYSSVQKSGTTTNLYTTKGHGYGGSIFLRRYVPLAKRFYFFGQGAVGANKNTSRQKYNNQTISSSEGWGAVVNFSPGLTYGVLKKLYVESSLNGFALLGYGRSQTESTDANTGVVSTSKGSNFNFSTSLGSGGGFSIGFRLLL
jgi:hypothetical protein